MLGESVSERLLFISSAEGNLKMLLIAPTMAGDYVEN